ncbi:MAG TPA: class I SAM-dependent methyltransferase [Candidatus Binataceae bacterium]|nr:class I SAM-dependent methyltransferase [Candidatus Binataceae bacterium]
MNDLPGRVAAQFRNPTGFAGRVAGRIMLVSNRKVNRFVVAQLQIDPDDRVLEIGFGPGGCITMLAECVTGRGKVAGIDPSSTMIALASSRNRRYLANGRVELKPGTVSAIPYPNDEFDKVCSINNIYFWPSLADDLREIRRTMKSGGILALAFRKEPRPNAPREPPSLDPHKIECLLTEACFGEIRIETCRIAPWTEACVLARK